MSLALLAALRGQGAEAAGPCGDGSAKANACKNNRDCCTRYCVNKKCRCKPDGMACARSAHCCGGACKNSVCAGGGGGGGSCGAATCGGCCDGKICRAGTANTACGKGGKTCAACASGSMCVNGTCGTLRLCGALNCANGCCASGVCKSGNTETACGRGGETCRTCSASRPFCIYQNCEECRDDSDCGGAACLSGRCRVFQGDASFGTYNLLTPSGIVNPVSIFLSRNGNRLWIGDAYHGWISVWDRGNNTWNHRLNFGSFGDGFGQFRQPRGIWVLEDETVLVTDFTNNRVSIWRRAGDGWDWSGDFGNTGPAEDRLTNPVKIAASADGQTVLVSEYNVCGATAWTRSGDTWVRNGRLGIKETCTYGTTGLWLSTDGDEVVMAEQFYFGSQLQRWYRCPGDRCFSYLINDANMKIKAPRGISSSDDMRTIWTTSAIADGRGRAVGLGLSNGKFSLAVDYREANSSPLGDLTDISASADGLRVAFIESVYQAPRIHVLTFA
ncbi:MAG: hypothetical protein ACKOWF_12425 [Chloroflexota bacterium]